MPNYVHSYKSRGRTFHYFRSSRARIRLSDNLEEAQAQAKEYAIAYKAGKLRGEVLRRLRMPSDVRAIHDYIDRLLKAAYYRASKSGQDFSLTPEWVMSQITTQKYRCAVSGVLFDMAAKSNDSRNAPWRPSLDRIDPTAGYTPDNVRVVCVMANVAMGEWGLDALHKLARGVLNQTPENGS